MRSNAAARSLSSAHGRLLSKSVLGTFLGWVPVARLVDQAAVMRPHSWQNASATSVPATAAVAAAGVAPAPPACSGGLASGSG